MASAFNTGWRSAWDRNLGAAQFHVRRTLAKMPYMPSQVRVRVSPEEEIVFFWSYIVPFYDPNRRFFDYWGHDLAELRFLWQILKPGMTFLDIGAFHGIYSLVAAKRLGDRGQVIAFEPSPTERPRLKLHLRVNGFRSVWMESCALGAVSAKADFFAITEGDSTRGGLRPPASSDHVKQLPIEVIPLDQYLLGKALDRVDVMKIDVEGGELDVFRGATKTLTEMRPIIICEVLDAATRAWGYEAREIIAALACCDFAWFDFNPDGPVIPHRIKSHYPEVKNYLAVPREKCVPGAAWFPQ